MRMSSCFFSSRLNILISFKSELIKCFKTALPKEPVPPVIIRTLSLNIYHTIYPIYYSNSFSLLSSPQRTSQYPLHQSLPTHKAGMYSLWKSYPGRS